MGRIVPQKNGLEGTTKRKVWINGVCHQVETNIETECPQLVADVITEADNSIRQANVSFEDKDGQITYK